MRLTGFIGPSYTLGSKNVDCQRCVNLYPELNELGAGKEKEVASLRPTPGSRILLTLANGPIRGEYTASNGELYVVGRDKFYRIESDWTATELGTLNTTSGYVSIKDNGLQVVAVDGPHGYVWDLALETFTLIADEAFPGADFVDFMDGYFIFNKPSSQQFFISGLNEVTFDALDVATAEGSPDLLISLIVNAREVWLFGSRSTEVFYDSGNADFPFERIQGAYIEVGIAAPFSAVKVQNSVYWLAQDETGRGVVCRAQGYQPQRISTSAVETALAKLPDLSQARAYTYTDLGHTFYCLNIPGSESTWVFDTTSSLWHERAYTKLGGLNRHRADCHAFAYGTHVIGDYENGNLYALDPDVYSDSGNEITRLRAAPHLSQSLNRLFHNRFQLDMETGVGLNGSGQGINPKVMLQWSDDGGHTWSNERWVDAGKIGEFSKRVIWNRLGSSRDRVYRVKITDPIKVTLIGAELSVDQGLS